MTSTACDDQLSESLSLEQECRAARNKVSVVCVWTKSDDDNMHYESSCGGDYVAYESTPGHNGFVFCPFCSKPIRIQEVKS